MSNESFYDYANNTPYDRIFSSFFDLSALSLNLISYFSKYSFVQLPQQSYFDTESVIIYFSDTV